MWGLLKTSKGTVKPFMDFMPHSSSQADQSLNRREAMRETASNFSTSHSKAGAASVGKEWGAEYSEGAIKTMSCCCFKIFL